MMKFQWLLLLPVTLVLADCHFDNIFMNSNGDEPLIYTLPYRGKIHLFYWTNDTDARYTFELKGFEVWKNGFDDWATSLISTNQLRPSKWNHIPITMEDKGMEINGDRFSIQQRSYNRKMQIKSQQTIYWRRCDDISCELPEPIPKSQECSTEPTPDGFTATILHPNGESERETWSSAFGIATIIFIIICCSMLAIIICLVIYNLRLKKMMAKESETNIRLRTTDNHPNRRAGSITVNSLYGTATMHFQGEGISGNISNIHTALPEAPTVPGTIYEEVGNPWNRSNPPTAQGQQQRTTHAPTHPEKPGGPTVTETIYEDVDDPGNRNNPPKAQEQQQKMTRAPTHPEQPGGPTVTETIYEEVDNPGNRVNASKAKEKHEYSNYQYLVPT